MSARSSLVTRAWVLGRSALGVSVLAACSGNVFSSDSRSSTAGAPAIGVHPGGNDAAGSGGADAGEPGAAMPQAGASQGPAGAMGGGSAGADPSPGSGDGDAGGGSIEPDDGADGGGGGSGSITLDLSLSDELANVALIPTTLDQGVVLSEELYPLADNTMEPAFKIVTPSASYWLLRRAGAIVKAIDTLVAGSGDWIGQSAQAQARGLPSLGSCCEVGAPDAMDLPVMTTVEDPDKRSNDRVRLISESEDGAWRLRWDFFLTHVTLRIERAAGSFSFTYRGVPGASLDTGDPSDRLVTPTGAIYGTQTGMDQDILAYEAGGEMAQYWQGPVEWVYFYDITTTHALFFVQHHDDENTDRYQVLEDTAVMRFGAQAAGDEPRTFSFGFVGSNVHQLVVEQVERAVAIDP